jgi:hypothetical protein
MQRREFITLVGGAAASLPLAARAQQAGKVYRIGFLSYRGCGASLDPNGAFRRGLREFGYIEGRNLVLECRDAPGQVERFPDLALQLIRLKIDVLVAEGTPASLAAKQATTTTPIRDKRTPRIRISRLERARRVDEEAQFAGAMSQVAGTGGTQSAQEEPVKHWMILRQLLARPAPRLPNRRLL